MESEHLVSNEIIDYNIIINNMDEVIMYDSDDNSITTIESSNSIDSIDDDNILNSEMWDIIFDFEERNFDDTLINNKYIIGLPGYERKTHNWLYLAGISADGFLNYDINDVRTYLHEYSLSYVHQPTIHILKLCIQYDGTCNVIIKTFWLKIIQRKWKKIYKEKQEYIKKMRNPMNLFAREIGRSFYCPSLYGMITF
tara:strand:+ start:1787 stop:2377 length:591 start_codon:yes stop_codon:yes gene_type:complete